MDVVRWYLSAPAPIPAWAGQLVLLRRGMCKAFPTLQDEIQQCCFTRIKPQPIPVWQLSSSLTVTQYIESSGTDSHTPRSCSHLTLTISNLGFFFKPVIWLLSRQKRKRRYNCRRQSVPVLNATPKTLLKLAEGQIRLSYPLCVEVLSERCGTFDHIHTASQK